MMAHFAEIKNGVVVNMIVAEQEWIDTQEGVEYLLSTPSNPAYVDGLYIDGRFTLPQPYPSWTLDENYDWQAPIEQPADGKIYSWDETNQAWVEFPAI
jgi:hypothetical protein